MCVEIFKSVQIPIHIADKKHGVSDGGRAIKARTGAGISEDEQRIAGSSINGCHIVTFADDHYPRHHRQRSHRARISQAMLPEIVAGGGIEGAQTALARLAVDGGETAPYIKARTIPRGRSYRSRAIAGRTIGTRRYLILPDRAIARRTALKGIENTVFVDCAHHLMYRVVYARAKECRCRAKITVTIAYHGGLWHLPGSHHLQC